MSRPEITVTIEVYCECGAHLCNNSSGGTRGSWPTITVKPCEDCLQKERDAGYDEGYGKGVDDGIAEAESRARFPDTTGQ